MNKKEEKRRVLFGSVKHLQSFAQAHDASTNSVILVCNQRRFETEERNKYLYIVYICLFKVSGVTRI